MKRGYKIFSNEYAVAHNGSIIYDFHAIYKDVAFLIHISRIDIVIFI